MRLPDPVRSRVVLVGVAKYSAGLRDLPAVSRNVADLQQVLVSAGGTGVREANCVAVLDARSAAEVMVPLHAAAEQAVDVLMVYFAGHGLLMGGQRELHLALSTTVPGQSWTAIPYTQVADVLRASDAAVKVVVLDCCYSGRAKAVPLSEEAGSVEQVEIDGVYVMTSSPGTRESFAPPDGRHTVFTGAMLEVLADGMREFSGLLSIAELFAQVRRRVKAAGFPEPQQYNTNTAANLALVRGGPPSTGRFRASAAVPTTAPTPPFSVRTILGVKRWIAQLSRVFPIEAHRRSRPTPSGRTRNVVTASARSVVTMTPSPVDPPGPAGGSFGRTRRWAAWSIALAALAAAATLVVQLGLHPFSSIGSPSAAPTTSVSASPRQSSRAYDISLFVVPDQIGKLKLLNTTPQPGADAMQATYQTEDRAKRVDAVVFRGHFEDPRAYLDELVQVAGDGGYSMHTTDPGQAGGAASCGTTKGGSSECLWVDSIGTGQLDFYGYATFEVEPLFRQIRLAFKVRS
ncbi:caspase family protein [Dactylosporangium sp. NPDC005572]|uniref:caspase family protein n=1 Tax=Dactylosporangium sp. NPDC005572 TaxID=3156889 RepID=UPI0033A141AC